MASNKQCRVKTLCIIGWILNISATAIWVELRLDGDTWDETLTEDWQAVSILFEGASWMPYTRSDLTSWSGAQEGREVRRDVFGTSIESALPRFRQRIAEFEGRTIRPLSPMAEITFDIIFEWANNATRLWSVRSSRFCKIESLTLEVFHSYRAFDDLLLCPGFCPSYSLAC